MVTGGYQMENRELLSNGYSVLVWDDENVLEMNNGDSCSIV